MSENYRAIMICDLNNPKSQAYADVSIETWKDVEKVEIEKWQCYTPDTMQEADCWKRMPWAPNLKSSMGKYRDEPHYITPTEQACLTSMFHWWEHIKDTHERVIILEHDAYVRDSKKLNMLIDLIPTTDLWSAGIAAECITMSPMFVDVMMDKWKDVENPGMHIDAGPMAELHTGAHDFMHWDKKHPEYHRSVCERYQVPRRKRFLWPTKFEQNQLGYGNDINMIFNGEEGVQRAPVTQCYYPGVNTIEHHSKLGDIMGEYSKGSYRQMEILDKLDYE